MANRLSLSTFDNRRPIRNGNKKLGFQKRIQFCAALATSLSAAQLRAGSLVLFAGGDYPDLSWFDANNWDYNGGPYVPTSSDLAGIQLGAVGVPVTVYGGTAVCGGLITQGPFTLDIGSGGNLIDSGDLSLDGGGVAITIDSGSSVSNVNAYVANEFDETPVGSFVTVDGVGATWNNSGNLVLGSSPNPNENGGPGNVTIQNGGQVTAATVAVVNGTITNSATLTLTGTAAVLTPSGGTFTQNASGNLNVQINDSAASGQYGQVVAGTANLAGKLNVTLGNGYQPTSADVYTIVSANSINGTFNNGSGLVNLGPAQFHHDGYNFLGVSYGANAVTVQPTYVITFYDSSPLGDPPLGHAFVQFNPAPNDPKNATFQGYFGFYPGDNFISGYGFYPGQFGPSPIGGDAFHEWDYSISYPVTLGQFNAAYQLVGADLLNPPNYSLLGYNCTDFVNSVAAAAGIQLPPDELPGAPGSLIASPLVFGTSLRLIGNGNTYAGTGGTVYFNSSTTGSTPQAVRATAISESPTPYDYDYSAIVQAGHNNPGTLASEINFPLDQIDLGMVNANISSGLSLDITGTDPTEDVISMNWGDGSAYEEQSLTFSHIYAAGTYNADLLVVDDGAVHSYDMTVLVSSDPGSTVDVDVAFFPAVDNPNVGVPEPTNIALLVPVSAMALGSRRKRSRPKFSFQGV
jgi:T5SS/PEP-CTERM-associated repeat protein